MHSKLVADFSTFPRIMKVLGLRVIFELKKKDRKLTSYTDSNKRDVCGAALVEAE